MLSIPKCNVAAPRAESVAAWGLGGSGHSGNGNGDNSSSGDGDVRGRMAEAWKDDGKARRCTVENAGAGAGPCIGFTRTNDSAFEPCPLH